MNTEVNYRAQEVRSVYKLSKEDVAILFIIDIGSRV